HLPESAESSPTLACDRHLGRDRPDGGRRVRRIPRARRDRERARDPVGRSPDRRRTALLPRPDGRPDCIPPRHSRRDGAVPAPLRAEAASRSDRSGRRQGVRPMNDHDLEVRLSGFYRAEVDGATTAPLTLWMAVADIPVQATRSGRTGRRPVLLLAAAMTVVGVGGTLALGAALVRAPERSPDPSTHFGITAPTPRASLIAGPTSGPVASPLVPTDGPEFEPGFRSIGNLATPRFQHTATLLLDGRVLIAGGTSSRGEHRASTEFWDPSTEAFTAGPPLGLGRFGHTATRLDDGRVLIVGGVVAGDPNEIGTREIELWDPATGLFRAAGLTTDPHTGGLTTVRLADGRVMIIGGLDCRPATEPARLDARPPCRGAQPAAEIWDPVTESVTPTGSPAEDHDWAAATLLADGRVFLLGGGKLPTIGSEVWDPATGGWSPGGAPAQPRLGSQSMTLLPDGRVLVVGGNTGSLNGDPFPPPLRSAEIWDPVTESFSPTG